MSSPPAVFRDAASYPAHTPAPVVTIGNFDGVHLGHRALLDAAIALAAPTGAPVCAYTFDPSPRDVMVPGHGVPAIQTLTDRIRVLGEAGADQVVIETFSKEFAGLTAADYAQGVLRDRLRAVGVVIGWDFRFGRGRAGDADALRALLGVPVVQVAPVTFDDAVVSSTRVRRAVEAGDVALAARLLARPHDVVGVVVRGDARGRRLGFPTANVRPTTPLLPPPGVYAVRVVLPDGTRRDGVANHGVRPTFEPGQGRLEVHLFDHDADLYGATLRVALVARLREERAFDSVDALVRQIRADADAARACLR